MIDDLPEVTEAPVPAWPKKCPCCGRIFLTLSNWNSLALCGYLGTVRSGGKWFALELRNCICASTISIEIEMPIARPIPVTTHDAPLHNFLVSVGQLPNETEEEHGKRCCLPFRHTVPCEPWPF